MKYLLASVLALSVTIATPAAFAGGPVIIEEEGNPEVIVDRPASTVGILPILIGVVVLCAVVCGGGSDNPEAPPPPLPPKVLN